MTTQSKQLSDDHVNAILRARRNAGCSPALLPNHTWLSDQTALERTNPNDAPSHRQISVLGFTEKTAAPYAIAAAQAKAPAGAGRPTDRP